jgi:thiol-disulfide isomerase/thioredoxin
MSHERAGAPASRRLPGRALRASVATAFLALSASSAPASVAASEASRFLPWTDPPPRPVDLRDVAGRHVTMADYRGKVVLVAFWASWCEFCREQMQAMQALRQRLADRPFEIVAVNFGESPRKVREYVKDLAVQFPVVLDPNQEAARAWRVRALPVSYVVGVDGRPRFSVVGVYEWAGDEAVRVIGDLLR